VNPKNGYTLTTRLTLVGRISYWAYALEALRYQPECAPIRCIRRTPSCITTSDMSSAGRAFISIYSSFYLSTYLSFCLSIYVYVSIYLSIDRSMYISFCFSIYLSICLSICSSIYLHMNIYIHIYLSIYLSTYIYIYVYIYIYEPQGHRSGEPAERETALQPRTRPLRGGPRRGGGQEAKGLEEMRCPLP